jgi:hypothetical protein
MGKVIALGICRCCGGLITLADSSGYIQLFCSGTKIQEHCSNYPKNCPAFCETIEDIGANRIQQMLSEITFKQIQISYWKWGKVFFSLNSHRDYDNLFQILRREGWLWGEIMDKHGAYYRAHPNKEAYRQSFLKELTSIEEGFEKEELKKRFEESISSL